MTYTRPDGMKCLRVLSKSNQATDKREDMEEVRETFSLGWGGGGGWLGCLALSGVVVMPNVFCIFVRRYFS